MPPKSKSKPKSKAKQSGGRKKRVVRQAVGPGYALVRVPRMAMQGQYPMSGGSWLSDAWDGFSHGVTTAANATWDGTKAAANFIKDNKLLSKGLKIAPIPGAAVFGQVADSVGLGRQKRASGRHGLIRT